MSEMKNFLLAFVLIFVATAAHAATAIEPSFNTAICVGNGGSTQGGQVIKLMVFTQYLRITTPVYALMRDKAQ